MTLRSFRAGFLIFLGLTVSTLPAQAGLASASRTAAQNQPQPLSAEDHLKRGDELRSKSDWDGAIAEYRHALRLDPQNALPHNNLGWALENKGDPLGAFKEYRTAHSLDPQKVPSPLGRFWQQAPLSVHLLIIPLFVASAVAFAKMLDLAAKPLAKRRAPQMAEGARPEGS